MSRPQLGWVPAGRSLRVHAVQRAGSEGPSLHLLSRYLAAAPRGWSGPQELQPAPLTDPYLQDSRPGLAALQHRTFLHSTATERKSFSPHAGRTNKKGNCASPHRPVQLAWKETLLSPRGQLCLGSCSHRCGHPQPQLESSVVSEFPRVWQGFYHTHTHT